MLVAVTAVGPGKRRRRAARALADQQLIAQQNRELDPQANDLDPATGQPRFTPLAAPEHHGHDRTGTRTASDMMTTETMAAAVIADPAQVGSWAYETPFTGDQNMVHVVCSPTGKCLFVVGKGEFSSYVYNPTTKTKTSSRHRTISSVRGTYCFRTAGRWSPVARSRRTPWKGTRTQYAFDFVTETYQKLPDMAVGRWYPSVVTMSDGRQLITSGFDDTGR